MNCQICCLPGLLLDAICPCCGWHQDTLSGPLHDWSSANGTTVAQATAHFEVFGACDEHAESWLPRDRPRPTTAQLVRAAREAEVARVQAVRMLALALAVAS